MNPTIIQRDKLIIAGLMGDGNQTALLWENFEKKSNVLKIKSRINENSYEVRLYYNDKCDCFVGVAVSNIEDNNVVEGFCLPASEYAVFDVVVANGYDSENKTMDDWLKNNPDKYIERKLDGKSYVVECYNEKFKSGIIEIWVPIHKG